MSHEMYQSMCETICLDYVKDYPQHLIAKSSGRKDSIKHNWFCKIPPKSAFITMLKSTNAFSLLFYHTKNLVFKLQMLLVESVLERHGLM